jgi:outer membrane protein assembly factor BamB
MTPPEPGTEPVRVSAPVLVDGALAFVVASTSTRSDVFAIDTRGRVVWSAAPGGFVSQLTIDDRAHTVYATSAVPLTNALPVPLLTGYAAGDGSRRSSVVAELRAFVGVATLGFSDGLVIGTQPNLHGEGGEGAFALHPETGALAWSGNGGDVVAITPSVTIELNFRAVPPTVAFDTATGAVRWQADVFPQAVAGGLVYATGADGLVVLRVSDGSVVTTVPGTTAFGQVTPAGGRVYGAGAQLRALAPA